MAQNLHIFGTASVATATLSFPEKAVALALINVENEDKTKVGEVFPRDHSVYQQDPETVLIFETPESVDVLIERLQSLKESFK